jgi:hypothetical protein
MADERVSYDEPHEELTRLAEVALIATSGSPEWREGMRMIAIVVDAEQQPHRAGLSLEGYEDTRDAFIDVLENLRSLGKVLGMQVMIAPLGRG